MKCTIFITATFFLLGCIENSESLTIESERIREAVSARKSVYAEQVMGTCFADILRRADAHVDSLITAEINYQLSDSIVFPPKPIKPEWPGKIIVPDSITARPIFRQ